LRVQLSGLGVDQVCGQCAGIAAKQRVRQRAVAPVEAGEVNTHEQLGERVEQPAVQVGQAPSGEQRSVGQRERQVLRDQHRRQRLTVGGPAVDHGAERIHDGDTPLGELVQQRVLTQHVTLVRLLEREDLLVHADEPHDVPGNAARNLHESPVGPVDQRRLERQVEQLGGRAQRGERVVRHSEPSVGVAPPHSATAVARRPPGATRFTGVESLRRTVGAGRDNPAAG
jgi:hypothetical protein